MLHPSLIVLDLGRVLIRICDGWPQACELAGVALPARAADPATQAELYRLAMLHETGKLDTAAFCARTAELVGLTSAQVRAISDAWLRGPYPGTHTLLDDLARQPIPTACLSNTNENHWRLMTTPGVGARGMGQGASRTTTSGAGAPGTGGTHSGGGGLPASAQGVDNYLGLERLTYRFASHLIGAAKPDPAIYAHVESITGAAPSGILFFDDDPACIAGARARGWTAIQITPASDPARQVRTALARESRPLGLGY